MTIDYKIKDYFIISHLTIEHHYEKSGLMHPFRKREARKVEKRNVGWALGSTDPFCFLSEVVTIDPKRFRWSLH